MKTLVEIPDLNRLHRKAQECLDDVLKKWRPCGQETAVPTNTHLYAVPEIAGLAGDRVFWVKQGQLTYIRAEREVFYYDEGSIIGLFGERERQDVKIVRTLQDEMASVVPYSLNDLFDIFASDVECAHRWHEYNQTLFQVFITLEESRTSFLPRISPRVTHFEPGEALMQQDDKPSSVFYVLGGRGTVYSQQVKVGEVSQGQLVGHMGMLMQQGRTATVIAETACDVITLSEDELFSLLQVRPDLCKRLFREMAQTIDQLNREVSGPVSQPH